MNTIITIIASFSKEERQDFLAEINRKTRRGDAKNAALFKLIVAGKTKNLDVQLYGKPSKNAYHALCKRLQDCLIDYVARRSFEGETSEDLEILKLLLASRIFFEQRHYSIAFKTLEKAENRALQTDLYAILNEIYHTKIQYAHLNPKWMLAKVITASERNMKLFQQELQLNQAYATIKWELKENGAKNINATVINAFSKFSISIDETLTYKSLFQLMEITATSAKLQRDFHSPLPFMLQVYAVINKKDQLADKHRFYHIKILNLMAVSHFRTKRFQESMRFVEIMEVEMKADNRRYFKRFFEKWVLIKALNHNYTGSSEITLGLLASFPNESFDIDLVRAMCLFHQSRFREVYDVLKKFDHSDDWYEKKTDWIWVLKKNVIEILVLIELDNLDVVLLRIKRFKRRFTEQLKEIGEQRVLTFIHIVERYYENPKIVYTPAFKEEVENSFEWLGKDQEDVFVMSFYAWLKAKMENRNLYEVTLELMR
ncbi:MAG: hypothetical protein ACFCUL_07930 [Flavobacteriaceae bacterium]